MRNDYTDPAGDVRHGVHHLKAAEAEYQRRVPTFPGVLFPFSPAEIRAVPLEKRDIFLRTVESYGALVTPDQLQALYDIGLERPGDEP